MKPPTELHVPIASMCAFLNHHGIATSVTENPAVFRLLVALQQQPGAHAGYLSVREFLTDGAITSVVGRALLMQLVVPDLEEFAESLMGMFTTVEAEVRDCLLSVAAVSAA